MQAITNDNLQQKGELPLCDDVEFYEPTEEDVRKLMESHMRELEEKEQRTRLYDPAERRKRTYSHCCKKYGKAMADKMLYAKKHNNGHIDKTDFAELMRRHSQHQKVRKSTPAELAPAQKTKNEPFIKIDHSLLKSSKVRIILKKSMLLYLYLRSYIVREKFAGDRLDLYGRYYQKGKLAASVSIRKLSRDLFMDHKTIAIYLEELNDNDVIDIEPIKAEDAWDNQDHSVYVFGEHNFNKVETYYVDKIATIDQ